MRKLMATLLCIMLLLCLYGCRKNNADAPLEPTVDPNATAYPVWDSSSVVFTFPQGCTVGGIDLSGMLGFEAYDAIRTAVDNYTIRLNINGNIMIFWGEDFELSYSESLMQEYVNTLKEGKDPSSIVPITYNRGLLQYQIATQILDLPTDVSLVYNEDNDCYDFTESASGTQYDLDPVMDALDPVILSLGSKFSTTTATTELPPTITAESEVAKSAQEEANRLLDTDLTYSFTPDNSKTMTATIDVDDIGKFYTFDSSLRPVIDENAVMQFSRKMSDMYSVGTNDGKFLTSLGEYIDFEIYYADQLVDADALAADIIYCLDNGITGAREASYLPAEKGLPHDLGGNYVEVNLTKQCLWVYNNYECVMHTPIVSGCLANDWETPNGAFDVVYKEIGATLMGLDVTWWAPFYRGYGLHDAPWRVIFDDDEYLFNGSHGCVNIPPSNMRAVFNNISWDTPVIVYGGANNGEPVQQVLSGTTQYDVGVEAGTFKLDITPKYGSAGSFTYTSDNPEIATVSEKGVVTVLTTGTVHIVVESYDWDFCPSVQCVVTINVHEDCSEVGHMIVNWKQTASPTCYSTGSEMGVCTSCDYAEYRTVDEVHNLRNWSVTIAPTCTEAGEQTRSCRRCDHKEVEEIPAVGHIPVGWQIVKPATDTEPGEIVGWCYYCGMEFTKEIPLNN